MHNKRGLEYEVFTHSNNSNEPQAADSFGIVESCLTEDHIEASCFRPIDLNHFSFRWCVPVRRTCNIEITLRQ